jgi:hypothetical protein
MQQKMNRAPGYQLAEFLNSSVSLTSKPNRFDRQTALRYKKAFTLKPAADGYR